MPYYRCLVNGTGFPGAMIGREGTTGFYTTRWIQAANPRHARAKTMLSLRREPLLQPPAPPRKRWFQRKAPRGPDFSQAAITFVKVERMAQLPSSRERAKHLIWYRE